MAGAEKETRPSTDENAMAEYFTKNYFMHVSIFLSLVLHIKMTNFCFHGISYLE